MDMRKGWNAHFGMTACRSVQSGGRDWVRWIWSPGLSWRCQVFSNSRRSAAMRASPQLEGDTQPEVEQGGLAHWRGWVLLLAEAPVDALAEQVGVPVMAGVFLDHVHEQLAQ